MSKNVNHVFKIASAALVLVGLFLFAFYNNNVLNQPFTHDEVDYIVCAEKGIWHNAVGENTLTLTEFVTLGKYKSAKDSAAIVTYSATLPNPNNDVFVLRHYHPPLPVYYWSLFNTDDYQSHERGLRLSNWLLVLISALVFYVIAKVATKSDLAAFLSLLIWFVLVNSELFAYAFSSLNFHYFLGIFAVIGVYQLLNFLQHPNKKSMVLFSVSLALMVVSLESSVFVIGLMVLAVIVTGQWRKFLWKPLFQIIGLSLVIAAILWPAIFLKGELIKSIGMYFSRIIVNENLEYNEVSYLANWWEVIKLSPVWFLMVVFIQGVAFKTVIKSKANLIPYIIGWGYCLLMTPFILNKTYIIPGIFLLTFATCWSVFVVLKNRNISFYSLSFAALSVLALIVFGEKNKWYKNEQGNEFRETLVQINALAKQNQVLIFPGHIYQYYLGQENIDGLGHPKINHYGFTKRYDYARIDISDEIAAGKYGYVLIPQGERYLSWENKLKKIGFIKREDIAGFYTFQLEK